MPVSPHVLYHVLGQQNTPPTSRHAQGRRLFLGSSTAAKLAEWVSSLLGPTLRAVLDDRGPAGFGM